MNRTEVFEKVLEKAKDDYDGHFTLLKFTTNYKFCFGTLMDVNNLVTMRMASGKTAEEAMEKGLKEDINCYDIEEDLF